MKLTLIKTKQKQIVKRETLPNNYDLRQALNQALSENRVSEILVTFSDGSGIVIGGEPMNLVATLEDAFEVLDNEEMEVINR